MSDKKPDYSKFTTKPGDNVSDEWGTPYWLYGIGALFERADSFTGAHNFYDPCPSKDQPEAVWTTPGGIRLYRLRRLGWNHFKKNDSDCPVEDARYVNFNRTYFNYPFFINPPFSNPMPWFALAEFEYIRSGRKSLIILPGHAHAPWFQAIMARCNTGGHIPVRMHPLGRVAYRPLMGQKVSSPRFGSVLVSVGYEDHEYDPVRLLDFLKTHPRHGVVETYNFGEKKFFDF